MGDIQGCAQELEHLLTEASYDPSRHRLIPVGDTINRGPDAPGVLRTLREAEAEPIVGNHERALLEVFAQGDAPNWLKKGSAHAQLAEAGELESAVDWFRTWPVFRRGAGWIVVHAGLHPAIPPERTDPDFLTEVRFCNERGERPEKPDGKLLDPPEGYQPWHAFYTGEDAVIYGHWARQGLTVREKLRGLDSGCVYGGQLTGLWWPEDRLVQVESQQPYRRLPIPLAE